MNTYNREIPDCLDAEKFEYTTCRTHEANVHIPTDKEFMVCCSCTDDCVNRSQCECWQLTIQEAQVMRDAKHSVGYVHHRLKRPQPSAYVKHKFIAERLSADYWLSCMCIILLLCLYICP